MEPLVRNMLNEETKHAVFIIFLMNVRCRQDATARVAALGDSEGRGGCEHMAGHIPTMLAVLSYPRLLHISIHFPSFIKPFFPLPDLVLGRSLSAAHCCSPPWCLSTFLSVPANLGLMVVLYKWLCRVEHASRKTSSGAQKA